jgi:hypothetical protein
MFIIRFHAASSRGLRAHPTAEKSLRTPLIFSSRSASASLAPSTSSRPSNVSSSPEYSPSTNSLPSLPLAPSSTHTTSLTSSRLFAAAAISYSSSARRSRRAPFCSISRSCQGGQPVKVAEIVDRGGVLRSGLFLKIVYSV